MPKPEHVTPAKFPDPSVLYDDGRFAIASGHWEGQWLNLACRWNYDDGGSHGSGSGPGYPKMFNHPTWMVMPDELSSAILTGLIASRPEGTRLDAVKDALNLRLSFKIGAKVKYVGPNENFKNKIGLVEKSIDYGTGYMVKIGDESFGPVSPNTLRNV